MKLLDPIVVLKDCQIQFVRIYPRIVNKKINIYLRFISVSV